MKTWVLAICFLTSICVGNTQSLYFPPVIGTTWDTLSPASLGYCQPGIDALYQYLETENSKAFILLKDGKIVLEKYFGTFTQDSIWYWASAGKTLTATAVGIAQQEGFLSITDTTSAYLGAGWTDETPQQEEKITIRHQLTMTSGLDDGVPDNHCTLDTCLQYLADAGNRWAYHNAPYTLLDEVLQSATGQSLNSYLAQKIGNPIGLTGLFIPVGYDNVYFSKPRGMARFGLLMLNRGNWNGTPVLSDTNYFHDMVHPSQSLNPAYGYLWWLNGQSQFMLPGLQFQFPGSILPHAPADVYAAMGKNGQFINISPSENLVFIRMGNAPGNGTEVPAILNDSIWVYLNNAHCTSTDAENPTATAYFYPNPAQDCVYFTQMALRCNIYDALGKCVLSASETTRISTTSLSKGIYLVEWESEGGIQHQKLIIE